MDNIWDHHRRYSERDSALYPLRTAPKRQGNTSKGKSKAAPAVAHVKKGGKTSVKMTFWCSSMVLKEKYITYTTYIHPIYPLHTAPGNEISNLDHAVELEFIA